MRTVPGCVYRDLDQAALDREYSPSSLAPDMADVLRDYRHRSALARQRLRWRELRYGPHPAERLDFFPAPRPGAPMLVFVHGGYWQELGKDASAFAAEDAHAHGAAFAAIGYGLAPEHRLDDIVGMVRRAVRWLWEHAADLGVDPGHLHLVGSSAGAQLVAMCLLTEWLPERLHPTRLVRRAVLLSGVYDLEPIRLSYVNDVLGLDPATARRNSPLHHLPQRLCPLVVAQGGHETAEFARQHRDLVRAVRARGQQVLDLVSPERNHFDLAFELADPRTVLGRAVLAGMPVTTTSSAGRPLT